MANTTTHMPASNSFPERLPQPQGERVAPAFRIGNGLETEELIHEGKRLLCWVPSEYDDTFKEFAGWTELLGFIADYIREPYEQLGAVDASLQLDTVAVTKADRKIFVSPPHTLTSVANDEDLAVWFAHLVTDIQDVLSTDQNKDELMRLFIERLGSLKPGGQDVVSS
jgi:hypothetical protein